MSGFRDDDDPDDVTLWAGRLRPWPAAPATDGVDDDTVRSLRTAPGDGSAARRAAGADDDTLRSRRAGEAGSDPGSPAQVEVDEQTSPRSRRAGEAGSDPGFPAPVEVDGQTSPRSRPADSVGRNPDSSGLVEPEEQTSPRSRSSSRPAGDVGAPGAAGSVEDTLRSVDGATEEGARPRSSGARGSVIAAGAPEGRDAHVPVALHRESYAPRVDAPVRVSRAASGRMPHTGDAASSRPRRAPDRARLVLLASAVVAVTALAVVGVILLLG